MMSIETIQRMSRERAEEAAANNKVPFIVTQEDIDHYNRKRAYDIQHDTGTLSLPFPNIGDYRPEGFELVEELFVDSSGFGLPSEPAFTIGQLLLRLRPGMAYAIVEEGQFQIHIGEFSVEREEQ